MSFNFERIAERKIEEAIEEGLFDNLPGKGQPLNLDDDPMTPPHLRAANKILKNAGVLPGWMQADIEIEKSRKECVDGWARIEKEYHKRLGKAQAAAGPNREKALADFVAWRARTREAHIGAMKRVNLDITKLNMMAPSVTRVHIPFKIADETTRFDEMLPAPSGIPEPQIPTKQTEKPGGLRDAVAGLYRNRADKGRISDR
jgi:DnaJ family protein C protein 28